MCAVALKRSPRSRRRSALPGAKPAPYPGFITPCDPPLRVRAPEGSDWIDGYCAQLHIHDGRVRVFSRSGYDWTEQFSQLARAAEALSARELTSTAKRPWSARPACPISRHLSSHLAEYLFWLILRPALAAGLFLFLKPSVPGRSAN
jgi:hypothetical protein